MSTSPQLNVAEAAAGKAALEKMIADVLPSWQRGMIPAGMLDKAVAAVVTAVDKVRDAQ